MFTPHLRRMVPHDKALHARLLIANYLRLTPQLHVFMRRAGSHTQPSVPSGGGELKGVMAICMREFAPARGRAY